MWDASPPPLSPPRELTTLRDRSAIGMNTGHNFRGMEKRALAQAGAL